MISFAGFIPILLPKRYKRETHLPNSQEEINAIYIRINSERPGNYPYNNSHLSLSLNQYGGFQLGLDFIVIFR